MLKLNISQSLREEAGIEHSIGVVFLETETLVIHKNSIKYINDKFMNKQQKVK